MRVELLYFDGCPNWTVADERIAEAAQLLAGRSVTVHHRRVVTQQDAINLGFTGSPTILIDGQDPFATGGEQVGLACRVYSTPNGLAGAPSVSQLIEALS